ncbi:arylesterase [Oricola indica]|jgi:acyl-CoA thioesterase-1|uniref:arylesterase n=1 Tax=Oricola indica TaxID=2872591 RepID=UPI001CBB4CCC|nr:arylesterase [Oricola indica]
MFKSLIRIFLLAGALVGSVSGASADTLKGVGFGDSLMAGYQLAPGEGFPEQLEEALKAQGHDIVIANAGVSGDTTSGGLARLDWSVPDDTDFVILELGANDALRGVSPDLTRENLDAMISGLKARGVDVILAGMLAPPNMGDDYAAAFNPIYPDLAEKHDVTLYPFFLDGVTAQEDKLLADGMHPNAVGVAEMVGRFLPLMEDYLAGRES